MSTPQQLTPPPTPPPSQPSAQAYDGYASSMERYAFTAHPNEGGHIHSKPCDGQMVIGSLAFSLDAKNVLKNLRPTNLEVAMQEFKKQIADIRESMDRMRARLVRAERTAYRRSQSPIGLDFAQSRYVEARENLIYVEDWRNDFEISFTKLAINVALFQRREESCLNNTVATAVAGLDTAGKCDGELRDMERNLQQGEERFEVLGVEVETLRGKGYEEFAKMMEEMREELEMARRVMVGQSLDSGYNGESVDENDEEETKDVDKNDEEIEDVDEEVDKGIDDDDDPEEKDDEANTSEE